VKVYRGCDGVYRPRTVEADEFWASVYQPTKVKHRQRFAEFEISMTLYDLIMDERERERLRMRGRSVGNLIEWMARF